MTYFANFFDTFHRLFGLWHKAIHFVPRTRKSHISHIQIVDKLMHLLVVVIGCKNRLTQCTTIFHGQHRQLIKRWKLRFAPKYLFLIALCFFHIPIAKWHYHYIKIESFGFVHSHCPKTSRTFGRCNGLFVAHFVPPTQKAVQIGAFVIDKLKNHILKSLQKHSLVGPFAHFESCNNLLCHFE